MRAAGMGAAGMDCHAPHLSCRPRIRSGVSTSGIQSGVTPGLRIKSAMTATGAMTPGATAMTPNLSCRTRSGIQCGVTPGLRIKSAMTRDVSAMTATGAMTPGATAMTATGAMTFDRHCEERSDAAVHAAMDCHASLAMTGEWPAMTGDMDCHASLAMTGEWPAMTGEMDCHASLAMTGEWLAMTPTD